MLHTTVEVPVVRQKDSLLIAAEEVVMGDRIGRGTFGDVYRGEWQGTDVVVKVMRIPDDDIRRQCQQEIEILRSEIHIV